MTIYLLCCEDKQHREVDLDDHVQVLDRIALRHLADEEKHPSREEHGEDAAYQRPPKDNLHNNARLAFDLCRAEAHTLDKVQGEVLGSRVVDGVGDQGDALVRHVDLHQTELVVKGVPGKV